MIKIATSILNAHNRQRAIDKLNNSATDYIHIDIMDNQFVPNYQLPPDEVISLIQNNYKPLDIHLMVEDPELYINKLKILNVDCISIHIEITKNLDYLIKLIKSLGYKVGLAIKPKTDINTISKYLNKIDKILIMSVEPGFGGQKFIPETINRISQIRKMRKNIIIEVDGGINDNTINDIKEIIDIAVVGSYITNQDDYNEAINNLKIGTN